MLTLAKTTATAVFAHLWDLDEDGQPETRYVQLSGDFELSKVKAANTGYRLMDLWIGDNTIQSEF
jgi:hypothetical protein